MPTRKATGSIGTERSLSRRITYERERRKWKQVRLAFEMTQAGCPMTQSAISRIEKDDPPRRITVDELVAFSQVFGIRADELLLPPELVADGEARRLLEDWRKARAAERAAEGALMVHVHEHPHTAAVINELLSDEDRITFDFSARRDAMLAIEQAQAFRRGDVDG